MRKGGSLDRHHSGAVMEDEEVLACWGTWAPGLVHMKSSPCGLRSLWDARGSRVPGYLNSTEAEVMAEEWPVLIWLGGTSGAETWFGEQKGHLRETEKKEIELEKNPTKRPYRGQGTGVHTFLLSRSSMSHGEVPSLCPPNPASDTRFDNSSLPHGLRWCFFGLICCLIIYVVI